ncbi:MAG TPA: S1C family serine protease [Bryobacteraceae bacterium]|nr:S1C family serine protease [Bryobacteraceae bacterium]
MRIVVYLSLISGVLGQRPTIPDQVVKAYPSVALISAQRGSSDVLPMLGTAVVIQSSGVLLTAYHLIRDAYSVQVRFKNGEVFDDVQLLGVDARRDVAAIKIRGTGLPALMAGSISDAKPGDAVTVIGNPFSIPWSVSVGIISRIPLADEVPWRGTGYRVVEFSGAAWQGSSGAVLLDSQGRALGLILGRPPSPQNLDFAVPIENVLALANVAVAKTYANAKLHPPGDSMRGLALPPKEK